MLKSKQVLICESIEATSTYNFHTYVIAMHMRTHVAWRVRGTVAPWVLICGRCLIRKGA